MKQSDWGIGNLIIRLKKIKLKKKPGLIDKLDPYLIISSAVSDEKIKTEVATADNGLFRWDKAYSIRIYPNTFSLDVNCYDYDTVTKDDFMGNGTIYIQKAVELRYLVKTIILSKDGQNTGEVEIELEYYADDDEVKSVDESESMSNLSYANRSSDIIMDVKSSVIRSTKYVLDENFKSNKNILDFDVNTAIKPSINLAQANNHQRKVVYPIDNIHYKPNLTNHIPLSKQNSSESLLSNENSNLYVKQQNLANPLNFDFKQSSSSQINIDRSITNQQPESVVSSQSNYTKSDNIAELRNPLEVNVAQEFRQRKRTNSQMFINMINEKGQNINTQEYLLQMIRNKDRRNALNQPFDIN